ncbi:MAG: cation:proton antiporter [Deltaproteobacteria bacterium]
MARECSISEGICYGFLVPIFFASLPLQIRFSLEPSFLIFSLAVIVVAVLGKLVGCGLGAILFKYNLWKSGFIRFGMNGHGAVDLVIVVVVLEEIQTLLAEGVIKAS